MKGGGGGVGGMQRGHLLDGMEVGESQRGSGENGMGEGCPDVDKQVVAWTSQRGLDGVHW